MAEWNSPCGEIKKYIASEDELWSLTNYFFSDACKKTSTYKFGFLKAIMDSLFSGELTSRGYELSFRAVISNRLVSVPEDFYDSLFLRCFEGETMAENVWISDIMSLGLGVSCGFVEQRIWSMREIGIIQLFQDGENMSERIWEK